MDKLREWVNHNVTDRRRHRDALLDERERELTKERDRAFLSANQAESSQLTVLQVEPPTSQTAAFFKLPAEIRLVILRAAFGDRTVHMHIRRRVPAPPSKTKLAAKAKATDETDRTQNHCGESAVVHCVSEREAENPTWHRERRQDLPEWQWEWFSCECHHNPPEPVDMCDSNPLWSDTCLRGEAEYCDEYRDCYPGVASSKCRIGGMGWLMSCRQAYIEAVHVLYSTNTITISNNTLMDSLLQPPTLNLRIPAPSQHFYTVKALRLRWNWWLFVDPFRVSKEGKDETEQRADFAAALDRLPRTFPNLSSLHISFTNNLISFGYRRTFVDVDEFDEVLFYPLSEMAGLLPKLHSDNFIVEIPITIPLSRSNEPPMHDLPRGGQSQNVSVDKLWHRKWD